MKEITFEELVEENLKHEPNYVHVIVEELLQQVREATIAECRKCLTIQGYDDVPISFFEQKYKMNQLPTDRIKTEK